MRKCPFCGVEIKLEDVKFCPSCGKELSDDSAVIKSIVKEAIEEGAKELKQKIDEIEKKVKELETGGVKAPYVSTGKHRGYDLKAQGREIKAQVERFGKEQFVAFSTQEGIEEWSKFLIDVLAKALGEGTDSEGGYLVPEQFVSDIITLARNSSYALQYCNVMPMTTDVMNVPTEASLGEATWIDEAQVIPENNPSFGQVNLIAKKLGNLARVSNELLRDSAVDIVSLLTNQFAYKIGQALDYQVFQGAGTPFVGILNGVDSGNVVSMASGKTGFGDISAEDLSALIEKLEEGYLRGAVYVLGRLAMHYIRTLKDNNGAPIYANLGGQVPGTIYGYPRLVSENMPNVSAADTKFIIFGNLKNYIVGRRLGATTLEVDPYGKFDTYETRFRMVTRWGLGIGNPKAFAVLKTATS